MTWWKVGSQTNSDKTALDIDFSNKTKSYLDKMTKEAALMYLREENLNKENTKDIVVNSLDMNS